jgi:hypothetical protein
MISQRDRKLIAAAKKPFVTLESLASRFNISKERVRQILKAHGIDRLNWRKGYLTKSQLIIEFGEIFFNLIKDQLIPAGKKGSIAYYDVEIVQTLSKQYYTYLPRCKICGDRIPFSRRYCDHCGHPKITAHYRHKHRFLTLKSLNPLYEKIQIELRRHDCDIMLDEFREISGLDTPQIIYIRNRHLISFEKRRKTYFFSSEEAKQIHEMSMWLREDLILQKG